MLARTHCGSLDIFNDISPMPVRPRMGFAPWASPCSRHGCHSAYSDRRELSISGDAGFLMNLQELETAVRLKIKVVAMVWVHGDYGPIKWKQQTHFQSRHSALEFDNPDFIKLAERFGLWGRELGSPGEIVLVLEEAFTQDGPALTAVSVDHSENMKLTARLGKVSMRI